MRTRIWTLTRNERTRIWTRTRTRVRFHVHKLCPCECPACRSPLFSLPRQSPLPPDLLAVTGEGKGGEGTLRFYLPTSISWLRHCPLFVSESSFAVSASAFVSACASKSGSMSVSVSRVYDSSPPLPRQSLRTRMIPCPHLRPCTCPGPCLCPACIHNNTHRICTLIQLHSFFNTSFL